MRLVIVESPYAGDIEANVEYARAAIRDALSRGEAPIASHLLYTQPGVLRDGIADERQWGIDAGLAWIKVADATVVYTDKGISKGMQYGIDAALKAGRPVEHRSILKKSEAQMAEAINVQKLWSKYEDIAMHFNDLLMRLRSASLAGIAAVSTLVGIFAKEGPANLKVDWLVAESIFIALAFFWIAIGSLDIFYYNRLLMGAVAALIKLESDQKEGNAINIDMSTHIDGEFRHWVFKRNLSRFKGVLAFYFIVFVVIVGGAIFCRNMYAATH